MLNKKRKALTLIELIITLGILVIMVGVVSTFFLSNYKQLNSSEQKVDLQVDVQSALTDISNNTKQSNGVEVLGTIINTGENQGYYDTQEFTLKASEIEMARLTYSISNKDIIYRLNGDNTVVKIENASTVTLARNVENLLVKPLPDGSDFDNCEGIEVKLKLQGTTENESVETRIYFRNKIL